MRQAESQHPNPIICPLVKDCTNIKNICSFLLPISNSEEPKKYRPYYFCYSRAGTPTRKAIDPNCKNPVYTVVDLDARIIAGIKHIAHDRAYFQKLRTQEHQRPSRSDADRIALMQRIDKLDIKSPVLWISTSSVQSASKRSVSARRNSKQSVMLCKRCWTIWKYRKRTIGSPRKRLYLFSLLRHNNRDGVDG